MIGSIYKITNRINSKSYIGKTYMSITKRFAIHINDSKKERNNNRLLYKAFKKYGPDNFTVELLGTFENGILEEKEIEYISLYATFKNGYNLTLGGDGTRYFAHADEDVIQTYTNLKSVKHTATHYNCTTDTIRNILRGNNISIERDFSRPICCTTLDISFETTADAAKYLLENNIAVGQKQESVKRSIQRVLLGTRKSYLKLIFVDENESFHPDHI
jgi:hypothetical protein